MPDEQSRDGIDPSSHPKYWLDAKKMDCQENPGWIGRFIGSPKNAPNNIAFVVVVLILVCGGIALALPTDRADIWKTLIPVVTLTLGYIFGKNGGKD